jgi:acetate---CoA ligase (ADP-forming)
MLVNPEALNDFFNPRGVAFIGQVDMSPFMLERIKRWTCPVCYVNPRLPDAGDTPVYAKLTDVPDHFNLAIIKAGARNVPEIVEDCAKRGIRNIVVYTNGFSEAGAVGAEIESRLSEVVKRTGVRLLGPNTTENTFESIAVPAGHRGALIGLITHSGFQGRALVEGTVIGAGFSRWVPTGNEVGLEAADMIGYFAQEPRTGAIAAYIEGFKSGPKLRAALRVAEQHHTPVVILKIGSTAKGAKMAASHTGHLAGADGPIDGLFRQHAVTRVRDLDELLETANLFAKMPAGTGTRCALYSFSGANSTIMGEVAESYGVPVPTLTAETQEAIRGLLPATLHTSNPVDTGGVFMITNPLEHRLKLLDIIAADPNIDIIVFGIGAAFPVMSLPFVTELLAWAPTAKKPVVAIYNSPKTDGEVFATAVRSGVPIFRSFRGCFQALRALADYQKKIKGFRERVSQSHPLTEDQKSALRAPGVLSAADASRLLTGAGVNLAAERLVHSAPEARSAAETIGYPVAMKLLSPQFPHKTDVGLVALGIADAEMAERCYRDLMDRVTKLDAHAQIDGVLVQEHVGAGVEIIVGLTYDVQMGSTLTIGAGGIYAEILHDVSIRPLPVDAGDVHEMIDSLKIAPLLAGARGGKPANKDALVALALKVAALGEAASGAIAELDLNPVIVQAERVVAVDALVIAGSPTSTQ